MNKYAPVENWKQRQRHGMTMSRLQMGILQDLRTAKQDGFPFIYITKVDPRTLRAMQNFGWIYLSPGGDKDQDRYTITDRGLKALKIFEQPSRRYDGICPACNTRPKEFTSKGKAIGYCKECARESKRKARAMGRPLVKPNRMCSCCREKPVHVYSSGKPKTYCKECLKQKRSIYKKEMHKRLIERIKNGEFLACCRCKTEPRWHTENTVFAYSHKCYRDYMNDRYEQKRLKAISIES